MFLDQYRLLFIAHYGTYQRYSVLTYARVSHLMLRLGRLLFGNATEGMECIQVFLYDDSAR